MLCPTYPDPSSHWFPSLPLENVENLLSGSYCCCLANKKANFLAGSLTEENFPSIVLLPSLLMSFCPTKRPAEKTVSHQLLLTLRLHRYSLCLAKRPVENIVTHQLLLTLRLHHCSLCPDKISNWESFPSIGSLRERLPRKSALQLELRKLSRVSNCCLLQLFRSRTFAQCWVLWHCFS